MNKKTFNFKNIKYLVMTLLLVLGIGFSKLLPFASTGEEETSFKVLSIVFIILDVVLFFVMYYMVKIYKSIRKKINVEKNLQCNALLLLAFTQNLFIILVVIFVLLFLTICEFAYLISESKKELKELKLQAQIKSDELNKQLENGSISYVMTSDAWYDIAMEECLHIASTGESVITYLKKEIEKEEKAAVRDDARIIGLNKALEEALLKGEE